MAGKWRTVRGACPLDCPDTCSWEVMVEDGRAVSTQRNTRPSVHARQPVREGGPIR